MTKRDYRLTTDESYGPPHGDEIDEAELSAAREAFRDKRSP